MRTSSQIPRVQRSHAGLIVVDLQERLLPAIFEHERLMRKVGQLLNGAKILSLPILVTEQYRNGLGGTVPQIAAQIPEFTPLQKMTFSAAGADGFAAALREKQIAEAILCGIEAHVCVTQTCLDLLVQGLAVYVVADAVSSRTAENHRMGLERMRDAGAVIVSTEMVLFELIGKAGTEEFKQILALVK